MKTHPEYRHGQLVDYGNPEALKWIQDTIYGIIAKHKIDVFRQDFNMDPGPVWRDMDAADRVGIAEAKHIAGVYKFLDDMRARFPDILQENCASGGRRIDMEMISRAHTYCRSDYYIGRKPGDTAFILGQNATLNLIPYLPFQGCEFNCVPVGDDYAAFSIISSGTVITPSDFDGGIIRRKMTDDETAWFKKVFDVAIRMRPFYLGDFYQLTDETGAGDDVWCAWQCDRPDLKAGFAIFFRRSAATENSRAFRLGGIDPTATYAAGSVRRFDRERDGVRIGKPDSETRAAIIPIDLLPEALNAPGARKKRSLWLTPACQVADNGAVQAWRPSLRRLTNCPPTQTGETTAMTQEHPSPQSETQGTSRREFLRWTGAAAAGSALLGVGIPRVHAGENNTIRLALIGCGGRGSGAVGNAMNSPFGPVELYAMADVVEDRLTRAHKALSEQFGDRVNVPKERQFVGFDAYKKAIDCLGPNDVAMVTSFAYVRSLQLEYAVKKGVNVFMEKSFGPDAPALRRLIRPAKRPRRRTSRSLPACSAAIA